MQLKLQDVEATLLFYIQRTFSCALNHSFLQGPGLDIAVIFQVFLITFNFTSSNSPLLTKSLFQLFTSILCQGFITGRWGANTTIHLLSEGGMNNRCAVNSHGETWREVTKWHLIMIMRHTCYLCSDLQTEELAQKFVFYAIIQLIYCRNWNLNCAVGELVLFNYTVVNDTWAYWNWFNREKEHRDLRGKRLLYKNKEGSQWYNTERKKDINLRNWASQGV